MRRIDETSLLSFSMKRDREIVDICLILPPNESQRRPTRVKDINRRERNLSP